MLFRTTEEAGAPDIARLVADVSSATEQIEARLLKFVREAAQGRVTQEDLATQLPVLAKELQGCYRQLAEAADRRDLSFHTITSLDRLCNRCLWLYRKIHFEQAFYKKLELEARLRSLISQESYTVYQEILCVEDNERGLLGQSNSDLRRALLGLAADELPSD
jgi:hypothetical protein